MAIRTRPPRTVSDIKTRSGTAKNQHETYRNYFQVGALELERWRREREREASSERIAEIDKRLTQINEEKQLLLQEAAANATPSARDEGAKPADKTISGLRIKY